MVIFDRGSLKARLAALDGPAVIAFLASCVQRRERCVEILDGLGRSADLAAFGETLGNLWRAAGDGSYLGTARWDALDHFDEVRSDEEAEGILAFSEDGIVSLWYATQFARNGDREFAFHCASRCYDSAGFVDEMTDDADSFADTEVQMQLADLGLLETASPSSELLSGLRARSIDEAERIYRAVARIEG